MQAPIRPWLWLLPALTFVLVFLVYPGLSTIALSLFREPGRALTLDHYAYFFTSDGTLSALRNNAIWLVLLTALAVGGGLLLAVLFDRVRYEAVAKSVIFMPLAISFVGAAEGIRLIGTGSLADATREQSSGPQLHGPRDSPFRWGTGFMLDSTVRTMAGPGSFGHDGAGGQLAFAHARLGVALAYVNNQMGGADDQRANRLSAALRACLDV